MKKPPPPQHSTFSSVVPETSSEAKSATMASHKLLQNGKIKYFSSSGYDGNDPFEPPPAYSARPEPDSSSWPSSSHPICNQTKIQEALSAFQYRLQEAVTQNHQGQRKDGTEQDREIRRQLLHLMGEFLNKVSNDSPRSIQDLPATVQGLLQADLYMAPQEAVPLSTGWHLSGVSQKDDEIVGRVVQEGRVWPTETQSTKQDKIPEASNGSGSPEQPDRAAGLWSAVNDMALDEPFYDSRGTLWWDKEREAQELARTLDLQLNLSQGDSAMSPGNDHVQIKMLAEYMTFRRENDMGLWESKSGWTIVMAVTLLYPED